MSGGRNEVHLKLGRVIEAPTEPVISAVDEQNMGAHVESQSLIGFANMPPHKDMDLGSDLEYVDNNAYNEKDIYNPGKSSDHIHEVLSNKITYRTSHWEYHLLSFSA